MSNDSRHIEKIVEEGEMPTNTTGVGGPSDSLAQTNAFGKNAKMKKEPVKRFSQWLKTRNQ